MANVLLGSKSVGDTVKLKVNGTLKDFIVVQQGRPSTVYDSSCDGTWLLMKDIYETRQWHSSNSNSYSASTIHSYLNSTFLNLFDSNIKSAIKQVKIPYRAGTGYSTTVTSGSNGLSTKIFLLSATECSFSFSTMPSGEGAELAYFKGCADNGSDSKRIAYLNGSATCWWLRSPYCYSSNGSAVALSVNTIGDWSSNNCSNSYGIRPALILPSSLFVDDSGSVTTNTAPTVPGSITVPDSIMGGTTITVSWEASTDAESNLAGYKVERSTDGGSTWSQIYQGTATSTTNAVAFGTESVMYRVKAYDDDDEESAYRTSAQVTVINNNAPTAPASISVPNEVNGGGTLVISWAASTDEDDNLSGYILERSDDGGDYAEIYRGTALTYTDTVTKGLSTVQYRVCAYDPYVSSAYTTGTSRTVNNNTAPVITCSTEDGADLGSKTSGFSISYSVDDEDEGDELTVTETLDGVTKRTFTATRAATNSFAVTGEYFMKVLNGSHTMVISVTDGTATTKRTFTFTKAVTEATVTLETPMEADAQITLCAITVSGSIPADAEMSVLVTNNANDGDATVWEDCTQAAKTGRNHAFTNSTQTNGWAFNFKVDVKRGASGEGGYITSIQGGFQ